ncbi:MAG: 1-acyl-sn-glycerol-3-phosphate acyltransferase [Planctomycetota bacterium]
MMIATLERPESTNESELTKTNVEDASSIALEDLFRRRRLNLASMSMMRWLLFLVYLPIGCVLSIGRFLFGFTIIMLAPRKWRRSLVRWCCGIIVRLPNKLDFPESGAFLMGNHSCYLDRWILPAACSEKREFATVVWHEVPNLIQWLARPVIRVYGRGRNREFLKQVREQLKQRNVILFPEGAVTDTKCGLLKFEKTAFALKRPIYLVAIRYRRPLSFVQPKALSTNLFWETAIELFQPWTTVELIPIGEFKQLEGESPDSYARRAQQALATSLAIYATNWSRGDRHRLLFE